ncbi:MAG: methionine--tRNA ligase [Patescibacteria group bacterium]|nr:methionine--tRNA ligase [Patescibacteria group bacterium]MBU1870977.1 methionine--tRNA ligase [Patescibacteria group bacterium]
MNKKSNNFYITTPIYYVNDKPHIGHAYTTVMADVFARYYRKIKGENNVFFLTGTDEHGNKVANSAKAHNLSPQEFANNISNEYKKVWKKLDISYDEFFRTTDPSHEKIVQDYLQQLYDKGFIYKAKYKGLYCVGCENFFLSDEIINNTCAYHPNTLLVEQEEENYFFKLKDFSVFVLNEINKQTYEILPTERKNEILGKINNGVNDISISRSGVSWGIQLPWDKSQTVYVWIDALLNYYSATKIYSEKEKFWPPSLHLMAKDILWFHSLVWEGLLLANKIELPKVIFAHGFFTINGQKISKTLGNVIDPLVLVNEYGSDAVRYLLISSFSFGNDGDISLEKFKEKYNSDLANGIGNLIARIAKLCETLDFNNTNIPVNNFSSDIVKHMSQYRPDEAIKSVWRRIADFNRIIGKDKPWKLEKNKLKEKLNLYIKKILSIAFDMEPFLPKTSEVIQKIFSQEKIKKPDSIFPRK